MSLARPCLRPWTTRPVQRTQSNPKEGLDESDGPPEPVAQVRVLPGALYLFPVGREGPRRQNNTGTAAHAHRERDAAAARETRDGTGGPGEKGLGRGLGGRNAAGASWRSQPGRAECEHQDGGRRDGPGEWRYWEVGLERDLIVANAEGTNVAVS